MGLNNSCFGWSNQVNDFAKRPGYQVLVLDNRGVSNSDSPRGRYTTSGMAIDVEELLEFVGWTEDRSIHVVGVSMGGMISQHLALDIPQRFASLSASHGSGSADWQRFCPRKPATRTICRRLAA